MTSIHKAKSKRNRRAGKVPDRFFERAESFLLSDSASAMMTKSLLLIVAMGGIAFIGATVPGLVKAVDIFKRCGSNGRKLKNEYPKQKIARSIAYLKKEKLVEIIEEGDGKTRVVLTNKGKKRVAEYSLDIVEIKKPEQWDGKWRVLMFDIPADSKAHRYARDALRNKIKKLGFCQIQKSVWAYPYECEDELLFITEMFKVQKYVEILTAERMLHEKILREKFPLL